MGRTVASVANVSQRRFSDAIHTIEPSKLHAFLPKMVGVCTSRKEGPLDGFHQYTSSILFVDVSGFSDAASKLHSMTNEGAELISHHLNKYFTSIINIIHDHGGDIVLFSGDAIMASWWQPTENETEKNTILDAQIAVKCASTLLNNTGSYKIEHNNTVVSEMGLHIGISQGNVALSIFGGSAPKSSGRWKYLLHGQPVHLLGLAVDVGQKGQIIICQSIMDILRNSDFNLGGTWITHAEEDFFLFESLDGTPNIEAIADRVAETKKSPRLPPLSKNGDTPSMSDAQLISSFVFDTLILSASSSSVGQLRTVSVVFIRLCKAKCPLETIEKFHANLSEAVFIIQRNLARVDGILNKVVMDDKGIHCLCLFGIPHHCHTDDAERSVTFALKMSSKLTKVVGQTSIGIARALVYCGMTGSSDRAEYTVLGDGVNIAARLMTRPLEQGREKKRNLLCSQETVSAVRQGRRKLPVVFVSAGEYLMKGKDKPVSCYHILSENDPKGPAAGPRSLDGIPSDTDSPVSSTYSSLSSCSSLGSIWSCGSRLSVASGSSSKRCSRFESKSKLTCVMPFNSVSAPCTPKSNDLSFRPLKSDDFEESLHNPIEENIEIYCRSDELSVIREFCENLKPLATSKTKTANEVTEASCLIIAGGHRSGKSLILHCAKDLLRQPSGSLTLICGHENSRDVQFGAVQGLAQRLLSGMDTLGTQRNKNDLQLLSFLGQHNILLEPTEDQRNTPLRELIESIAAIVLELLMQQVSMTPILLVDDIHWVDAASSYLLLSLKKLGVPCLFAGRPEFFEIGGDLRITRCIPSGTHSKASQASSDSLVEGVRLPGDICDLARTNNIQFSNLRKCVRVDLRPLKLPAQASLISACLSAVPEPRLLNKVSEMSAGVAGIIVAILSHLTEENVISYENNVAVLTDSYVISEQLVHYIPGYEATVYRELDALSPPAVKVLRVCSILGYSFDKRVLMECLKNYSTTCRDPESQISHLLKVGLLLNGFGEWKLEFDHPLSRDAVYLAILSQDRRDLHLIAEKAIGSFANEIPGMARERVRHLLRSSVLAADIPIEVAIAAFEESVAEEDYQTALQVVPLIPIGSRDLHIRHYLEAYCLFEMSQYSAAQVTLRKLSSTISDDILHWYQPEKQPKKKSILDCCFGTSAVEDDKKGSDLQSAVRHRVDLLSKEIDFMIFGDGATQSDLSGPQGKYIREKKKRKKLKRREPKGSVVKSPIYIQMSLTPHISELMKDYVVDRSQSDFHTVLALGSKPRVSVKLSQKLFRCIPAALFGDKATIEDSLSYLGTSENGGKYWVMVEVILRVMLRKFYNIDKSIPTAEFSPRDIQSPTLGWLKEEVTTPTNNSQTSIDFSILSTLQIGCRSSVTEALNKLVESDKKRRSPSLIGLVALTLCEQASLDQSLLGRAVVHLKEASEKESVFTPAYLYYEALSRADVSSRKELLLKCINECVSSMKHLEGPFFWKARRLLASDNLPAEALQKLPENYRPRSSDPAEARNQVLSQLSLEKTQKGFSFPTKCETMVLDIKEMGPSSF